MASADPTDRDGGNVLEEGEDYEPSFFEDPKRLVRTKADKPAPVGFGPIDQTWPVRMRKAGTYDAEWLETRFPGFAADIDWTFFNAAPEGDLEDPRVCREDAGRE